MKVKKLVSVFIILGIFSTLFVGCSSKKETDASNNNSKAAEASSKGSGKKSTEVKKIRVAVANDFNPYAYLDKDGNYVGYEVEVLKKVDELLPQYEFDYQTVSDQFVGLTSNKVDLIAHQWETNPKRQEAYLFGTQLVTTWAAHIVFKEGRTDINSYKDLEGKTVQTFQGSNDAYILETYNKENKNAIKLVYGGADTTVTLNKLKSGAIDAYLSPLFLVKLTEKNYKVKLGTTKVPVYNSNTYFIYRKNDAAEKTLRDAVDGALKTITEDGTLKKLSEQLLGADYTTEADIKAND